MRRLVDRAGWAVCIFMTLIGSLTGWIPFFTGMSQSTFYVLAAGSCGLALCVELEHDE